MIWTEEGYFVAHTDEQQSVSVILRRRMWGKPVTPRNPELFETFLIHVPKPKTVVEIITDRENCPCWNCQEEWGGDIGFDIFNRTRLWTSKRRHLVVWDRCLRNKRTYDYNVRAEKERLRSIPRR